LPQPFLAALLFMAAAQLPPAQPPTAPVSEALLDEFIAAMPHQEEWKASTNPDPAEVARFVALNGGREADVRTILAAYAVCRAPTIEASTVRTIRTIGSRLGPDKVRQLIAAYRSEAFRTFDTLQTQKEKGNPIPEAQQREVQKFIAANPVLIEFAVAVQGSADIAMQDQALLGEAARCGKLRSAAFERAKLKGR
jgi:hypothetical protein